MPDKGLGGTHGLGVTGVIHEPPVECFDAAAEGVDVVGRGELF